MSVNIPPFPDLVGSIDLPNRQGKPGMSTLWIAAEHPLVPDALKSTGRVLVLVWRLRPSFMKAVYERAREAEAPHWSEDLANLGESCSQSMARVYSCHCSCSFRRTLWRSTAVVILFMSSLGCFIWSMLRRHYVLVATLSISSSPSLPPLHLPHDVWFCALPILVITPHLAHTRKRP